MKDRWDFFRLDARRVDVMQICNHKMAQEEKNITQNDIEITQHNMAEVNAEHCDETQKIV